MERNHLCNSIMAAALLLALAAGLAAAQAPASSPLGTAFTYQGQLKQDGNPVDGTCDFEFSLWDAPSNGNPIGSTQSPPPVGVADGIFTVQLDFGSGAFQGDARWLEIAVCCPTGCDPKVTLTPRQALTASPYALYSAATSWTGLSGVPAGFADGIDDNTIYSAGAGLMFTSTTTLAVDTTYIQRRVSGSCAAGSAIRVVAQNGQVTCQPVDANAWLLTGNAGTTPGTNFLGTTDNQPLELRVSGARALRLEPNANSPNIIGGSSANWLAEGVLGATIGGGGSGTEPNRITDVHGAVGGGMGNQAGDGDGDVWDSFFATEGGGEINRATGALSTIAGGYYNYATGAWSTVPGGWVNQAQGDYSFAAGRNANAQHDGSFVWADSEGSQFASSAPNQFLVRATGGTALTVDTAGSGLRILPDANSPSLIGGHSTNWLAGGVYGATIAGGGYNQSPNAVTDIYGTVGGGSGNMAGDNAGSTWDSRGATVGGGEFNAAAGDYATIGGGESNFTAGTFATVGGGWGNDASADWATVAGGNNNSAGSLYTTVGGGDGNTATDGYATVGGGRVNLASGQHATVAGGESNEASGNRAAVGGGLDNNATGAFTAIPGGSNNTAQGWYSFAAGHRAKANSDGCFVWGDSTDADVTCSNINRWVARASGGVWFYTNAAMTSGAYLAAGSGTWSALSDRSLKENVAGVDTQALLATLAKVPITTWNYTGQDDSIRHIGPMAQDFYAAFGVGEDDTHITTVDADGVALAAIQALYAENLEMKAQLADLDARLTALEQSAGSSSSTESRMRLPVPWLVAGGLVIAGGGALAARQHRPGGVR